MVARFVKLKICRECSCEPDVATSRVSLFVEFKKIEFVIRLEFYTIVIYKYNIGRSA